MLQAICSSARRRAAQATAAAAAAALRVQPARASSASSVAAPPRENSMMKLPENAEYCSSCILPTDWAEVPLVSKKKYNHDSTVFTFGLPEGKSLSLPVCACVLLRGYDAKGEVAVRPYTPTSSNDVKGSFDLLVKVYENGTVSKWLDGLEMGAPVGFKHIPFNIKAQYPFGKKTITMIAGGTGITPMYQALQLLAQSDDATEVTLLYGNKSPADVLLKDELDELAKKSSGRIKIVNVVGERPDQPPIEGWDGELGWVDKAKLEKYAHKPSEDTMVMVCGLPVMYDVFCGPRGEKELKEGTVLHQLGYTTEMVAKF